MPGSKNDPTGRPNEPAQEERQSLRIATEMAYAGNGPADQAVQMIGIAAQTIPLALEGISQLTPQGMCALV